MVTRHRIRKKGMIFMFAGIVRLGAFRPAFDRESYTLDASVRKDKIGSSLNFGKKLALELKVAEKGKEVPGEIIFATGPETTEIWTLIKQNLAPSIPGPVAGCSLSPHLPIVTTKGFFSCGAPSVLS